MSLVDCPNVKCRCTSSLWFSYVIALLFSNGFLPPGTTCLAHCKLQCFCVGLSSACTRRRSNLTGTAVACFLDILIPPVLDVQNGKTDCSSTPLIHPIHLPVASDFRTLRNPCLALPVGQARLFGNHPWIMWPAPDQEHWAGDRPVQNFSKVRSYN